MSVHERKQQKCPAPGKGKSDTVGKTIEGAAETPKSAEKLKKKKKKGRRPLSEG